MTYDAQNKLIKEASLDLKSKSEEITTWKRNPHGLVEEE
jgi:hypothetical protein